MKLNPNFNPKGKKILAITAHADDADFCAGGTLLKWISQGAKAAIVVATNGDKGSHDKNLSQEKLFDLRHSEQLLASKFLGLEQTWFLDYPDSHLEISQDLKEKLVKIIRSYKPDVVFTWDPTLVYSLKLNLVNHTDHRAIGQAALDACFPMARDFLTFKDHQEAGLNPHCVSDIFLFNFDKPNYYEDISDQIKDKLELLKIHKSQTSLKTTAKNWSQQFGKEIAVDYAETFVHLSLEKD